MQKPVAILQLHDIILPWICIAFCYSFWRPVPSTPADLPAVYQPESSCRQMVSGGPLLSQKRLDLLSRPHRHLWPSRNPSHCGGGLVIPIPPHPSCGQCSALRNRKPRVDSGARSCDPQQGWAEQLRWTTPGAQASSGVPVVHTEPECGSHADAGFSFNYLQVNIPLQRQEEGNAVSF